MNNELKLTHIGDNNLPKMVDVSKKESTKRVAVASGTIKMSKEAFNGVVNNSLKKGPVIQTSVVAAILGAKKTSELIPMCHQINLTGIECNVIEMPDLPGFKVEVVSKLNAKTGVEMESLTGVSIGLLTIYDMVKAIDKTMVISDIQLDYKEGGKSGKYSR